jgi:hypothetical protein
MLRTERVTMIRKAYKALILAALILCAGFCLPALAEDESYTFIWMSDTQFYTQSSPAILFSMTEWCARQREALNIRYVIHTGDIINLFSDESQWANADAAFAQLNGIPLFAAAGNHDIDSGRNEIPFLHRFGQERLAFLPTYGGAFKNGIGRYDLLDMPNEKWLLLTMAFSISKEELAWMDDVLKAYPTYTAILCVHSYMDPEGKLTEDGKKLYEKVVVPNPNVRLVLCGHMWGVFHNAVKLDDNGNWLPDRTVYQLVADYQDEADYGSGYLCILTFDPQTDRMRVQSYSPYLNDYNYFTSDTGMESFTLPMDMNR